MSEISYGNVKIDTTSLPAASIQALLSRGLSHYLGNEQNAKVGPEFGERVAKAGFANLKALRAAPGEHAGLLIEIEKFLNAKVTDAVKALHDGTVGESTRGPRGTALDTVIRAIASAEVKKVLANIGVTMPSGDRKVRFVTGEELTSSELIARRIARHGARLTKEAEAKMKADDRKVAGITTREQAAADLL